LRYSRTAICGNIEVYNGWWEIVGHRRIKVIVESHVETLSSSSE
jgi:hypothetical protein